MYIFTLIGDGPGLANILLLAYVTFNHTSAVSSVSLRPIASKTDISLLDCYKECNKRVECKSVAYFRRALVCMMYDKRRATSSIYFRDILRPGVVQTDVGETPQLLVTKHCTGNTCSVTACPEVQSYPAMTIKGNMRNIKARIAYFCDNFFTVVFSTCAENGVWSDINSTCITYSYEYAGPNTTGLTKNPLFVLYDTYLDACIKKCNETSRCLGVNFLQKNKTCISTHEERLYWTFLDGWKYYFNIKYPVTLHRRNGQWYNLTITEGVELCKSLGTEIATEFDIKMAYQLGYSMCACGWVESGDALIVLQTRCGMFNKGVRNCSNGDRFDVFCRNNNFVMRA